MLTAPAELLVVICGVEVEHGRKLVIITITLPKKKTNKKDKYN